MAFERRFGAETRMRRRRKGSVGRPGSEEHRPDHLRPPGWCLAAILRLEIGY